MRLTFLKDGLISEYEGRLARWHIVQGAALAAAGLAMLGYFGGSLVGASLVVVLALAAGTIALASHVMRSHEAEFERLLKHLVKDLKSLKRGGALS